MSQVEPKPDQKGVISDGRPHPPPEGSKTDEAMAKPDPDADDFEQLLMAQKDAVERNLAKRNLAAGLESDGTRTAELEAINKELRRLKSEELPRAVRLDRIAANLPVTPSATAVELCYVLAVTGASIMSTADPFLVSAEPFTAKLRAQVKTLQNRKAALQT